VASSWERIKVNEGYKQWTQATASSTVVQSVRYLTANPEIERNVTIKSSMPLSKENPSTSLNLSVFRRLPS